MRFKVPQFIDIEDKIFGPFTFKQFMYMGGGAGLSYLVYRSFPFFVAIALIAVIVAISASLTFVKINGKPFIFILEAYIRYAINSKMYIWKKSYEPNKEGGKQSEEPLPLPQTKGLSASKLQNISWGLNIIEEDKK